MAICPHCEQIELSLQQTILDGKYLHCWVCGKVIFPDQPQTSREAKKRIKEEKEILKKAWHQKNNNVHYNNGRRRTSLETVEKVRQVRKEEKLTYRDLSARFNINRSTIQRILLHKCGY